MNNKPIGFFDSGLGGLTCIPHLMNELPDERIIYFGDTARTPYGSKTPDTILRFSKQITDFLVNNDVKMIIIACNTVTSICLDELQKRHPSIPIIGIIEPAAKKVAKICTKENIVGVIGTKVTIKSKAYINKIRSIQKDLQIFNMACPVFVPLIEEGIIENRIMDLSIRHYLDSFISVNNIDTLILGCTHYPLIRENIERIYPKLNIIDPSKEIVGKIKEVLDEQNMRAKDSNFENIFYASDLSENFIAMINTIFEDSNFRVGFKNFDLENL